MDILEQQRRQAFSLWLRTGRWPVVQQPDAIERKFNPYHDPRNGQFTFAPGGPRSLSQIIVSPRRQSGQHRPTSFAAGESPVVSRAAAIGPGRDSAKLVDAVYRPGAGEPQLIPVGGASRASRGSNSRAFQDPMTLQQAFPGLRDAPGGAIIALADNFLDITGPARELSTELAREMTSTLINQIRSIDPDYNFQSLGFSATLAGQISQINQLRFERAVV